MMKTNISLAGYQIAEQIYTGTHTSVYRGVRVEDRYPVIIKVLRDPFPSAQQQIQLRNQYTITKDLNLPSVLTPLALEIYQNSYALVTEDFGGISLKDLLGRDGEFGANVPRLTLFLQIAIQIAEALAGLYRQRIVHKDIKPANILFNPETQQVKLIDFSISSLLPRETRSIQTVTALEGTLAYISPEQTGRMNRAIDYRSDFYTFGATCYELLTGQLPFPALDPIELVHCHLAKQPIPADQIKPQIPIVISQIVSKLMAKNAEHRYQNALGLKHDLELGLNQLLATGQIESFELGTRDIIDRFTIPERLYGRADEVAELLAAFDRVNRGRAEMMLVAGYSGIGKTAVVQEIHKPIVRQRGYFISGKFDQFQRNIPFSAFVQAFRDLIGQLQAESDLQLQRWQQKILAAVGENGQVLIEVIPELESIIGKQPVPSVLTGSAAQQRFNLLLQKLIRVFTTASHPLVIFLDDLQWADLASLNLLKLLMQDAAHLLLVCAYRDNEISPIHPLTLTIEDLQNNRIIVNKITIKPLDLGDLNQLVADTLNCDLQLAEPLAKLVDRKTQGNPFFATQFLKSLHDDGLITFAPIVEQQEGGWQCDITQVRALALTDDVVEFMALQLQKLPPATQDALKLAACIGAKFDLDTLAIVSQTSPQELAQSLWQALEAGLLIPTTEIYKFFAQTDFAITETIAANPGYRFLHDRVQQAAYSLIPDSQKQATHLNIGRLLQQNDSEIFIEAKLFDLVGHLNLATDLITQLNDRLSLAQLNLQAGKKARNTTAYAAANIYFQTGLKLLPDDGWETQYQLTLDLHVAAVEAAYLNGDLDRMAQITTVVCQSARTILDKVEVYRLQIVALTANGNMPAAIDIGATALAQLEIELPTLPDAAKSQTALRDLEIQLADYRIEDLIDLPVREDRQLQMTMKLLADLGATIFIAKPELMPILSCKMVSLSLQFGNTSASAMGYINHGLVLSAFFGDVRTGYRFGKLALDLVDRLNAGEFQSRILFLFANWIQHRQESLAITIPILKSAYTSNMEAGEFIVAGYGISSYFDAKLLSGVELNSWQTEIVPYSEELARVKQDAARACLDLKRQVALNLIAVGSQMDCLIGDAYDETVMIPKHHHDRDLTALAYVYIYKLMLAYLFGNYRAARENITQAEPYLLSLSGMMPIPVLHFYAALTHLALHPDRYSAASQAETLSQAEIHQGTIQAWAEAAPMNYLHKWHLIEAEKQRILGARASAIEHYDLAIAGAQTHNFCHEAALANELAAKFYLDWGKPKIAGVYLIEAYYGYARWGATAKVERLTRLYPQLLEPILDRTAADTPSSDFTTTSNTIGHGSELLDLAAMFKATQAMSAEIELDRLTANLLNLVIASAGADKCVLLLQEEGQLQVIARVEIDRQPEILAAIPLDESLDVAISLVNTVKSSWEPLIVADVSKQPKLARDLYLQQHQPQSILCTPILHRGKLVGILYLENQIATGAFTSERLNILNFLTTQAAISIANAKLYRKEQASVQQLEQRVQERTIELQAAKEVAEHANQSKTDFFNYMSHELRNPLNSILGRAEVLQLDTFGALNEHQLKHVGAIERGGNHLLALINDFLDVAKIEAGKLELNCTSIEIADLCSSSLELIEPQAAQRQIQIDVKIPPNLPPLMVDERRMRQVLINLLGNAVKFTPAGGRITLAITQIAASTAKNASIIRIAVIDTGIGISPEHLKQLFQPFMQIDSPSNRKAQGTGLGLYLVKQMVELHGGQVTVTSEVNLGSCFTIDLPDSNLPFVFPLGTQRSPDDLASDISQPPASMPLILIADDNEANIETTSSYLRAKGYQTIAAVNGQEAIDLTKFHHPDLVLMDIQMPIIDGLGAIEQLRQDPEFANLPIIAVTALIRTGDRERCLATGANDYLSKPIRLKVLAQTIQDYLDLRDR